MNYPSMRAFNSTGLYQFERKLANANDHTGIDPMNDALSEPVANTSAFTIEEFSSAKSMAEAVLDSMGRTLIFEQLDNIGLWAWLTYVLRAQLFKENKDGTLKLKEYHRWYPSAASDWQKGQRHLVRMPVFLLASLGKDADHLLCNPVNTLPEIREQMTGQNDMMTTGFQRLARTLYYDEKSGKLKRGAGGKGAGSPRRLRTLRRQLGVTWQVEELPTENVLQKLPSEFDRFLAVN